jgi:hypothetical protein
MLSVCFSPIVLACTMVFTVFRAYADAVVRVVAYFPDGTEKEVAVVFEKVVYVVDILYTVVVPKFDPNVRPLTVI